MRDLPNINAQMNALMNSQANAARKKREMEEDNHTNTQRLVASSEHLESLLDGQSTFLAIQNSVNNLRKETPENHDTLIAAFGLIIDEVAFQHPHTIILSGVDNSGNHSSIVAHFSQLIIQVIHVKREEEAEPKEMGFHAL